MKKEITDETVDKILELGKLALLFGRTNRVTYHEDQETPESDTDHTVMLSLIACAFAEQFAPDLDRGNVAQFALVHDLVEAYAGDTPSFFGKLDTKGKEQKAQREHGAYLRIKQEFGTVFPWVHHTIEAYESLESPEARYVKTMDKIMPKVTHILNRAKYAHLRGETREALEEGFRLQRKTMVETYGHDQHMVIALYEFLAPRMYKAFEEGTP